MGGNALELDEYTKWVRLKTEMEVTEMGNKGLERTRIAYNDLE